MSKTPRPKKGINPIRAAYIMAMLNNGECIHRLHLMDAFNLSQAQATNDLRNFQEKYGKLFYDFPTRTYSKPPGYRTSVELRYVKQAVRLINRMMNTLEGA